MRVNSLFISILLSTLLLGGVVGSVGCHSSSSDGKKMDPFSMFHGKKSATPKQNKIEKSGPGTMDEFMSLERDNSW